jgi:hypothetical protein
MMTLSNLLNIFMCDLVIFLISKDMVEGDCLLEQLLPCFHCNLALIQAFPVHVLLAVFLFPTGDKLKSLSLFFVTPL